MWASPRPMITAEWQCTRCGATNRKLIPARQTETRDHCVHCGLRHVVRRDARPVRWQAEAA